jgi:hypothetical protein
VQSDIPYRPSARRARAAIWFFRAVAALGVPYVAAGFWRLSQPEVLILSIDIAPRPLVLSAAALALMGALSVVTRLCALATFVTWLYWVTQNLPGLGVAEPGVTPGWAVGCWFVPFLNCIAPCLVVQRVWQASDPDHENASKPGASRWPLLYAWWTAFIAMAAASVSTWVARSTESGRSALFTHGQVVAFLCSGIASIVMAMLATRVIREIEFRQTAKSKIQAFV